MQILFACAIVMSTARASSVFPSSYRNTIFNQSVYFLRAVVLCVLLSCSCKIYIIKQMKEPTCVSIASFFFFFFEFSGLRKLNWAAYRKQASLPG